MPVKLRSIEIRLPDPGSATAFLAGVWGLTEVIRSGESVYLRGSGRAAYIIGLHRSTSRSVKSLTFQCHEEEAAVLRQRIAESGRPCRAVESADPGGGVGFEVTLPEGEIFRFLAGCDSLEPMDNSDMPRQLTHVVFNSADAEASACFAEQFLGCRISDRTKGMIFVRCNRTHHSIAFARAGYSSLNHIAFEMKDIDAVMRGIGRMRDAGFSPVWGPGRHGPGNNVFAYFIAPFGGVIEFSTPTNEVPDNYPAGNPEDWVWPANRIDQWGVSDKNITAISRAEKRFRFQSESELRPGHQIPRGERA